MLFTYLKKNTFFMKFLQMTPTNLSNNIKSQINESYLICHQIRNQTHFHSPAAWPTRARQQSRPAGRCNPPLHGHAPTLSIIRRRFLKTEAPMGPIRRSMKRKLEPEPATHPPAAEAEARGVKPVRFLVRSSERLRTPPQPRASVPPARVRTPPPSRASVPQPYQVRGRQRQRVRRRVYRFLADLSSSDSVIFLSLSFPFELCSPRYCF
jgi:hypothetical protein